jgi:ArsR family transcriptional regulator, arsenate/arsenite/antimonite-responsive transcriptional repressor / arsenate reductase (thioredoxin)
VPVSASTSQAAHSPPTFLRLAAHPVRWSLLAELAHSDRRVGELCARLQLPQNLVSYHLARLRGGGVAYSRRSAADGRDSYYTLDLSRCRELLAGAGAGLHPGLQLPSALPTEESIRLTGRPVRVLFLCTGNSARSQIAEALLEHATAGAAEVRSAGSHPKPLHPNAVRVMRERGIDIAGRSSKDLRRFRGQRFDYVVSLCDRVREVCPQFPGHPDMIHWSIADPARAGDTDDETYPAFQRSADQLQARIRFLIRLIEQPLTSDQAR